MQVRSLTLIRQHVLRKDDSMQKTDVANTSMKQNEVLGDNLSDEATAVEMIDNRASSNLHGIDPNHQTRDGDVLALP